VQGRRGGPAVWRLWKILARILYAAARCWSPKRSSRASRVSS
jgi:hypothetical protein